MYGRCSISMQWELPRELSPLRSNQGLHIRVAYISFLPRLTVKEVEL